MVARGSWGRGGGQEEGEEASVRCRNEYGTKTGIIENDVLEAWLLLRVVMGRSWATQCRNQGFTPEPDNEVVQYHTCLTIPGSVSFVYELFRGNKWKGNKDISKR